MSREKFYQMFDADTHCVEQNTKKEVQKGFTVEQGRKNESTLDALIDHSVYSLQDELDGIK